MNRWRNRMNNLNNNQVVPGVAEQANRHHEADVRTSNDIALY